jgi:hypothetical protein
MGKVAFFFLSTHSEQRGRAHRGGLTVVAGGLPGHGGGREVGKRREEVEGNSFRSSPRAGMACGGRSTAAAGGL